MKIIKLKLDDFYILSNDFMMDLIYTFYHVIFFSASR